MNKAARILEWIARIICILSILFVSVFAADSFGTGLSFWRQAGNFIIHLLPSFVLLGILIAAWKWPLIGGMIVTIAGIAISLFLYVFNLNRTGSVSDALMVVVMLGVPYILAGVLFILSQFLSKKASSRLF